jgi:hypothetical protein
MAFRTFLSSLGLNAPRVETVLDTAAARPGDRLGCTVNLQLLFAVPAAGVARAPRVLSERGRSQRLAVSDAPACPVG